QDLQTIDDGDPSFATAGAGWAVASGQGFQNDIRFAGAGTGSSTATWTFAVSPGQYRVAATWSPYFNRATNAQYTLMDGSQPLSTTNVNQQTTPADFSASGVGWRYLGGVFSVFGSTLTVQLSNSANGYVVADGIRLEHVGALPASP